MDNNIDQLRRFIDSVKKIGLFGRIFQWKRIKQELIDAVSDIQKLVTNNELLKEQAAKGEAAFSGLQLLKEENVRKDEELKGLSASITDKINEINQLTASISSLQSDLNSNKERKNELDIDVAKMKRDLEHMQREYQKISSENARILSEEENRKVQYAKDVAALNKIREQIQADRNKEIEETQKKEIERIENMKLTWSNHQDDIKQAIKSICSKHTIKYVDKVSFKGDPDNTIEICNEYIVFDAKSPANDDLSNFPKYIKLQTESVKKYANQENVKKDIFLVIPSNTVDAISQFAYNMGNYNVYVISKDSIEPVLLSLQKIEEYEFADQLSPDERDNICRIIGKFAHTTKRKIQIDQFFVTEFLELLVKCKQDLPDDILKQVIEFEKAEKLNPPSEKRAKQILTSELQEKNNTLNAEAKIRQITIPQSLEDLKNID